MRAPSYPSEASFLAKKYRDAGHPRRHPEVLAEVAKRHGTADWQALTHYRPRGWAALTHLLGWHQARPLSAVTSLNELLYSPDVLGPLKFGFVPTQAAPFTLEEDFLGRHVLILGPSGVGATVLLENLMLQQMARGGGFLFLDQYAARQIEAGLESGTALTGAPYAKVSFQEGALTTEVLENAVAKDAALYVPLQLLTEPQAVQAQVEHFQSSLRQLVARRQGTARARGQKRFLVVVPGAWLLHGEGLESLMAQARAAGVALIVHDQSLATLGMRGDADKRAILQNTWTKLFLPSPDPVALRETADLLSPYLIDSDTSVGEFPPEGQRLSRALADLGLGDAVALTNGRMVPLRLQMVDQNGKEVPQA